MEARSTTENGPTVGIPATGFNCAGFFGGAIVTVRYSAILAGLSIIMLLAVPWVGLSDTWTLYYMALASLAGAAISFFALND
jgi:hypothetical protein